MHAIRGGCRQPATSSGGSWPGARARHCPVQHQPQRPKHTQWQQHPAQSPFRYGSLVAAHAPAVGGRTNRVAKAAAVPAAPAATAAAAAHGGAGGWVVVPEPLPSVSELPDEPPTRSELIDLTIAIGRAKTWQELRVLYWANRSRQGPLNVVAALSRLASLLPPGQLPQLLQPSGEDGDTEADDQLEEGVGIFDRDAAGSGRRLGAGQGNRLQPGGRGPAGGRGRGGRVREEVETRELVLCDRDRAALRQLVVRMVHDVGSFTRDQVAAGRLDELRGSAPVPWVTADLIAWAQDCRRQQLQLQQQQQQQQQQGQLGQVQLGQGQGQQQAQWQGPSFFQWLEARERRRQREERRRPGSKSRGGRAEEERVQDTGQQGAPPLVDPYKLHVTRGLEYWRQQGVSTGQAGGGKGAGGSKKRLVECLGPQELATLAWAAARLQLHKAVPEHASWLLHDLVNASYSQLSYFDGRQLAQMSYSLAALGVGQGAAGAVGTAAAAVAVEGSGGGDRAGSAGYEEVAAEVLAAAPGAVLASALPPRWMRRFLMESRRKLRKCDAQSLANLSYSLEPLRLRPGPGWLTDLLRASGKLMVQQQQRQQQSTSQHAQWQGRGQGQWQGRGWGGTAGGRGRSLGEGGGGGVNYSELTQLAWGVFSMRRKLYTPYRWAAEALAIARAAHTAATAWPGGSGAAATALSLPLDLLTAPPPVSAAPAVVPPPPVLSATAAAAAGPAGPGAALNTKGANPAGPVRENNSASSPEAGLICDRAAAVQQLLSYVLRRDLPYGPLAAWLLCQPPRVTLRLRRQLQQLPASMLTPPTHGSQATSSTPRETRTQQLTQAKPPAPTSAPLPLVAPDQLEVSLAASLHTCCWPGPTWLEALASCATDQLYDRGFGAQNLGMVLWSLAGLGYRPRPGWLDTWVDRVGELARDFRPENTVSVLCALSTWRELPYSDTAEVDLRDVVERTVPAMGCRELQLAAAALAVLCELPPQLAVEEGLDGEGRKGRAAWGRGAAGGRRGGRQAARGGRGNGRGREGLFVPVPGGVPEWVIGGGRGSRAGVDGGGGGATAATATADAAFQGGGGGRQRGLHPAVARLLVERAVEVAGGYGPRRMGQVLRLLVVRLGCPVGQSELRDLLGTHAVGLEAMARARVRGREGGGGRGLEEDQGRVRGALRRRALRDLLEAVVEVAGVVAGQEASGRGVGGAALGRGVMAGGGRVGGEAGTGVGLGWLGEEELVRLVPPRWWRAYLALARA